MPETPTNPNAPVPPTPGQGSPQPPVKRILVVDDDSSTVKLCREILAKGGYSVVSARDGKDAWLKMTPENMPQVIISDIVMPNMDGFAFLKQLKINPETRNIPILVISSKSHMEDAVYFAGAEAFLAKPFSAEQLLAETKKLFSLFPPSKK